jgi:hypothetical protein
MFAMYIAVASLALIGAGKLGKKSAIVRAKI